MLYVFHLLQHSSPVFTVTSSRLTSFSQSSTGRHSTWRAMVLSPDQSQSLLSSDDSDDDNECNMSD